jgi:hypothetical protein
MQEIRGAIQTGGRDSSDELMDVIVPAKIARVNSEIEMVQWFEASWKGTRMQLKADLEWLRVDEAEIGNLRNAQGKHISEVAGLVSAIVNSRTKAHERIRSVEDEMVEAFQREHLKNAERIRIEVERLDGALEELIQAKKLAEEGFVSEFRKWGELRCEIGESTSSICGKIGQRLVTSANRSPGPDLVSPTVLPSLHSS